MKHVFILHPFTINMNYNATGMTHEVNFRLVLNCSSVVLNLLLSISNNNLRVTHGL